MKLSRRACLRAGVGSAAGLAAAALGGCVSVGVGTDAPAHAHLGLRDAGAAPQRLATPLVPALLIQPLPGDALADTVSIAYARQPHEYRYYNFSSWTERPVRQLPRLLQQRLEAAGVAAAVGLIGEPLRADWLLTLGVLTLHHDVAAQPSMARLALSAELFDRRDRRRVARRDFVVQAPAASADAAAAAAAMSQAVGQAYDALLPWLEDALRRSVTAR